MFRISDPANAIGGYVFTGKEGYVAMEAPHYFECDASEGMEWKIIPDMGRTLGGVTLMPYTRPVNEASVSYKMKLPEGMDGVKVIVVLKSTLAFHNKDGHKYSIGFRGAESKIVNFNKDLNEDPKNIYTVYYPTVARRVIENETELQLPVSNDGYYTLDFKPLDPAVVLEKIIVDFGGYKKSYLYMDESKCERK